MNTPAPIDPFSGPLAALESGVRTRQISEEGRRAWRSLRTVGLATLALLLLRTWGGGPGPALTAVVGSFAVYVIVRTLTQRSTLPRFWRWALGLTGALTWIPGASDAGEVFFLVFGVGFLVFRRYRAYAAIGSRRRALVFLAAIVAMVGLALPAAEPARSTAAAEMIADVRSASIVFVVCFWALTAVHLFLGMRLHFLRLRPKLAIAGLLVAAVPVVLLAALAGVVVFGALGGSRATQAQSTLAEWAAFESDTHARVFGERMGGDAAGDSLRARLADAVEHVSYDGLSAGIFVREGEHLWAARIDTTGARPRLIEARRVTPATMQRLADMVRCEVQVVSDADRDLRITIAGVEASTIPLGEGDEALRARPSNVTKKGDETSPPWYGRWVLFGGTTFDVFDLERDGLSRDTALLSLNTRAIDLWNAYAGGENEVNQAVLAALIALAALFLLLEALALYFGLRITGGITHAVGTLHRATQRLARGDLGVGIDLANEDEFGDLADSFNEMTRAIRVAQEHLVQKQRLEQEIATARDIQTRLLPHRMPELSGWEVAGSSTPSKMVGGDYFDFLPLADGRLGVAIADVSGKGIPAALLMANLQASLQGQALHDEPVAAMVGRMNELLSRSTDAHMFATFFYAVLDPATGSLVGVNAGHEPPLLVRVDGSVERLQSGGLILGMLPGQSYRECRAQLDPGDVLVLYTDGITEAMGPGTRIPGMEIPSGPAVAVRPPTAVSTKSSDDEDDDDDEEIVTNFFEEERLRDVVVARRHGSADSIRRAVLDAVAGHTQGVPQSDDITLVVLRRVPALAG